jgi:hypothetical protein
VLLLLLLLLLSESAFGAGGPLGIDHNVTLDNDGVTLRRFQLWVEDGVVLGLGMGALWYGGESRIGNTYWRAVDAAVLGGIASTALKATFTRSRPIARAAARLRCDREAQSRRALADRRARGLRARVGGRVHRAPARQPVHPGEAAARIHGGRKGELLDRA